MDGGSYFHTALRSRTLLVFVVSLLALKCTRQ